VCEEEAAWPLLNEKNAYCRARLVHWPYARATSRACYYSLRRTRTGIGEGTKVCRYNWDSAGSLGWPFPMLKYKYIFQTKYTKAIFAARCYASALLAMGLGLSVSVTSRSFTKTAKRRITKTTPYDSTGTLVF